MSPSHCMVSEAALGSVSASGILEALDTAAVLFDASGVVLCANARLGQVFGLRVEELVGLTRSSWEAKVAAHFCRLDDPTAPDDEDRLRHLGEINTRLESRGYPKRVYACCSRPVRDQGNSDEVAGGRLEVLRDITSLVRREAELERQQDRHAREIELVTSRQTQADKFQLELTANVTHDLKTPIASIKASVSGLLAGDVTYEPQVLRETLLVIEQEADRLQRRVQNLLSLARMESGDAPLHRDWVDISDIIATACESLRSAQGIRDLRREFPDDLPLMQADYEQLLNAIRNLLENAYLYSPPEQPVEISVAVSLGQLRVRIRDYGQGLMPDEFERIFDKFYRGRSARRIPGTGLGLPICRRIAEAHGGRLWAEHAPGGGVVFVLSIPVDPPALEVPSDE